MKPIYCLLFALAGSLLASGAVAQSPGKGKLTAPGRVKVRPQVGAGSVTGLRDRGASSVAPGRLRIGKRVRLEKGNTLGRAGGNHRFQEGLDQQPPQADESATDLVKGQQQRFKDSPRIAMERALAHRLSQIDKMRDRALATGDLQLLETADRHEAAARAKFEQMTARMDQRRALGKPGVGPPVPLPPVDTELPPPEPSMQEPPLPAPPIDGPANTIVAPEQIPDPGAPLEPTS